MNSLIQLKALAKNISILYVEDDDALRENMAKYLNKFFLSVDTAKDGKEGLEFYKKNTYDLVMTDIKMPKLNGLDMAIQIKNINQNQNILIVSAYAETSHFTNSIKIGVDGYILKPIDYEQLNSTLYKISYKIQQFKENEKYKNNLEVLVEEKTIETKKLEEEKVKNYQKTLYALVKMIEDRDTYTGGHSQRVAKYSKMIAQQLKLDTDICENIYQAGILHDIGKIAIPDTILLKPGVLNDIEYKLIQEHVRFGVDILEKIPMFKELALYIEAHHERLDGSGYPNGLKGDEILLESQILAISDTFDAMTTSRIYKARKSITEALEEIQTLKGIHFRKDVVDAASEVLATITIDKSISQLPTNELEEERFSYFYKDQVTQGYNLNYLDLLLIKNSYHIKYNFINLINIHNINKFNTKNGWEKGNEHLNNISIQLQNIYKDALIFRIYGDNFAILTKEKVELNIKQLEKFICIDGIVFETQIFDIQKQEIFSLEIFESLK